MSETNILYLAIAGVVLIVGTIIFIAKTLDKKRTEAFGRLAARLSMYFDAGALELLPRLPQFELFNRGHSRRARNWIRGGRGSEEIWIFDYVYVTGYGKHRQTHHYTIAAFPALETQLPAFQLRPENIFHRIGAAFGYQDIDFEEHPEFSQRYLLRSAVEHAVRPLFTPMRVASLMSLDPVCVEADEACLLVYSPRGRLSPDAIPEFIDLAQSVRKLFAERSPAGPKYRMT